MILLPAGAGYPDMMAVRALPRVCQAARLRPPGRGVPLPGRAAAASPLRPSGHF